MTNSGSGIDFDIAANYMQEMLIAGIASVGNRESVGSIRQNRIEAVMSGIWMYQNDPMDAMEISFNTITMHNTTGNPNFASFGAIRFDESGNPYNNNPPLPLSGDPALLNNKWPMVENNIVKLKDARRGIVLQSQSRAHVRSNFINFISANGFKQYPTRTGIVIGGSLLNPPGFGAHQIIECNTISGDPNAAFSQFDINLGSGWFNNENADNIGFRASMTSASRYSCNNFDLLPTAMQFTGDVPMVLIRGNSFDRVSRGLSYKQFANTGPQFHTGNRWLTPLPQWTTNIQSLFGTAGAFSDATIPSSFTGNRYDVGVSAQYNPFSIVTPNLTIPLPPPFWFWPSNYQNTFTCSTGAICTPSGFQNPIAISLDSKDQAVIAGTFQSPEFQQTLGFQANCITYNKIKYSPSLAPTGSTAATFKSNLDTRSEGEFHTIAEDCHDLFVVPLHQKNQLASLELQTNQKKDQLYLLDSLWSIETDSTSKDSLQQLYINTESQLQPLLLQKNQLENTIQQNRISDANTIKTANNSIIANKKVEKNIKTVNKIYLKTIAKGIFRFTNGQIQKLDKIARQCPLEGGAIVYKARAMITFFTRIDYEAQEDCTPQGSPLPRIQEKEEGSSHFARLYPNPATNQVTLEWTNTEETTPTSKVVIYNALGQVVYQKLVSDNSLNINTQDWTPGMYICKLYQNEENIFTEKFVVIK